MTVSLEDRIRARAQELWEQEGRPDGKAEEHWRQASQEVREEDERGDPLAPGADTSTTDKRTPGSTRQSG